MVYCGHCFYNFVNYSRAINVMTTTNKISITKASTYDAELITQLSVATFCETFMKDNKQEDMEKYITADLNVNRLTEELNDANNIFFLVTCNNETVGYAKMRTAKIP